MHRLDRDRWITERSVECPVKGDGDRTPDLFAPDQGGHHDRFAGDKGPPREQRNLRDRLHHHGRPSPTREAAPDGGVVGDRHVEHRHASTCGASGSGSEDLGVRNITEQRSRDHSVDDEHRLVATSTSESAQRHNPGDHCIGGRFVERQCLRSNGEHVSSLAPPDRVMRRPEPLTLRHYAQSDMFWHPTRLETARIHRF